MSLVLYMFENSSSSDLEEITDSQFTKARISIRAKWADSVAYKCLAKNVEAMFNEEFGDKADIIFVNRNLPSSQNHKTETAITSKKT